jgi:hypothetical protein
MPESVLISLGETPLRRRTRRKSFPSDGGSEHAGVVLDLAAGDFLNLPDHLAIGDHAVDGVLDRFKDQGLLRFVHVVPPCFRPDIVVCKNPDGVNGFLHTITMKTADKKVKRPPGRPRTGIQPSISARVPKEMLEEIERWAEANLCTRSEATAMLLRRGLDAKAAPKRSRPQR